MTFEYLKDDIAVATDTYFRFGTDALLLADFAQPRKSGEKVCDLGTGCGCIPFLLLTKPFVPQTVVGVDIQPKAIELCRVAAAQNKRDEVQFLQADWHQPSSIGDRSSFDRVICNPPYFPAGSGKLSDRPERHIARHEQADTLSSVVDAAAYLLRYGGRFCMCHRPERLTDICCTLRAAGLEPKRVQLVQQDDVTPPFLVLVDATKGGKAGIQMLPTMKLDKREEPAF